MEEDEIGDKNAKGCNGPFDNLERNAFHVCEHRNAIDEDRSKNIIDVVDKVTR